MSRFAFRVKSWGGVHFSCSLSDAYLWTLILKSPLLPPPDVETTFLKQPKQLGHGRVVHLLDTTQIVYKYTCV